MNEFERAVLDLLSKAKAIDILTDNDGQLVIYTGLYEDSDGNLTDLPPDHQYTETGSIVVID
jgi:hypothetical protein